MDSNTGFIIVGIVIIVPIVLFLIFREAVLWYFRINERTETLHEIKAYLMLIAKAENPEGFKKFQDTINHRSHKSSLKDNVEKMKNIQTEP